MLRQSVFMSRQSLVKTKSFYVATELAKVKRNYVVTEDFCVAIEFGQDQEFLCHDKIFLCRDRVGQGEEKLCQNRVFFCSNRVWLRPVVFMSRYSIFVLRQSLALDGVFMLR